MGRDEHKCSDRIWQGLLLLDEGDTLLGEDGAVQGGKGFLELLEYGDGHDILPHAVGSQHLIGDSEQGGCGDLAELLLGILGWGAEFKLETW